MENGTQVDSRDAYVHFAQELCEAISRLLASQTGSAVLGSPAAANDNDPIDRYATARPSDPITLKEVQFELRLTEKQIVLLRRLWAFPRLWHDGAKLIFSRREVECWVRAQPNPDNLAAVLRLRRRRLARVVN